MSSSYRISGVRGMDSLPLMPLELHVADDVPPLSMSELRASLSLPPETLPFSLRGENLLCNVVVLPWFTVAGPMRVLRATAGVSGMPNRRSVTGVICLPTAM